MTYASFGYARQALEGSYEIIATTQNDNKYKKAAAAAAATQQ